MFERLNAEKWEHFILNYSECRTSDDFHTLMMHKLDFMPGYGKNLDALWDCITGDMYLPAYIIIQGIDSLSKEPYAYAERIISIFKEVEIKYGFIRVIVDK